MTSVPSPSVDFGIQLQDVLHQDWIGTCQPDQWSYVTCSGSCTGGNHGWAILVFDGCEKPDGPVFFQGLQLEVLMARPP